MTKILSYNHSNFDLKLRSIVYNNKDKCSEAVYRSVTENQPTYLPKENLYLNYDPISLIAGMIKSRSPIDRSGYLTPYKTIGNPMPIYDGDFNKSFVDVVMERASEIWKKDHCINVLDTGDVSSSVVYTALSETKPSNKTLVTISHNQLFNLKNLNPNNITVFGSYETSDIRNFDTKIPNWKDYFYTMSKERLYNFSKFLQGPEAQGLRMTYKEFRKNFFVFLHNHSRQSPIPIESANDMLWWLNFSFKRNHKDYVLPAMISKYNNISADKLDMNKWINFFSDPDWDSWNIKNHDRVIEEQEKFIKKHSLHTTDYNTITLEEIDADYLILDDGRIFHTENIPLSVVEQIVNYSR